MTHTVATALLTFALFAGMLTALEIGRRAGARRRAEGAEGPGVGAVDSAVFGLLGLLLAFTFAGASTRFDTRRELVVEETNAIGTAYLRLDLLPAAAQPGLRDTFRRYADSRLAVYQKLPDIAAARAELARSVELQQDIWTQAVAACRAESSPAATMLLLPALNSMIDITTTRTMATQMHPPPVIFVMLFGMALAASLLAGLGIAPGRRRWLHMLGFAAAMAIAVYVILDLEYPRLGLIRMDAFDQALVDLRDSMK